MFEECLKAGIGRASRTERPGKARLGRCSLSLVVGRCRSSVGNSFTGEVGLLGLKAVTLPSL